MGKIYRYLRGYFEEEFNATFYLTLSLFLALSLYANYYLGLEKDIIRPLSEEWYFVYVRFLFFATPLCFTIVLYALSYHKSELLRQPAMWLLVSAIALLLAIRSDFHLDDRVIMEHLPQEMWYWCMKLSRNLYTVLFFFLPVLWQWLDRHMPQRPYGFTVRGFDFKPYLIMLLLMAPLILWASYQPSFLKAYPRYWPGSFEQLTGWPAWKTVGLYELSYGLQFISLEYFFRGFMVLAFVRFLGPGAVLPMVSLYCWFHFGKPMGEAIGSIFGGFILGVIALRTRSIFGGILIHIGVAFGMELAAWLQKI